MKYITYHWSLLLLVILTSCKNEIPQESIRPVKAIQVTESSLASNQITFPGTLRAFKRADLSFRVDGVLMLKDISVGQSVKKDELLLQLDPREYEVALEKAKGQVQSIQAQLDFAERDYERMQKIYTKDPGAISVNLLDRRKESKNRLKADLAVALSDLHKAEDNLSYTSLKAPFEGVIAAIYAENHEQVRAKQTVVRLIDTGEREMEINVPEKYINTLLEGGADLQLEILLDAFPGKTFPASVSEIGNEASPVTQTYPVTLALEAIPIELSLLPGMSGKAILRQKESFGSPTAPMLKIPKSAIFSDNSKDSYVWIIDPNTQTIHKQKVMVEEHNKNEYILIVKGIKQGDWIITAGTSYLSEGQKVKFSDEPGNL